MVTDTDGMRRAAPVWENERSKGGSRSAASSRRSTVRMMSLVRAFPWTLVLPMLTVECGRDDDEKRLDRCECDDGNKCCSSWETREGPGGRNKRGWVMEVARNLLGHVLASGRCEMAGRGRIRGERGRVRVESGRGHRRLQYHGHGWSNLESQVLHLPFREKSLFPAPINRARSSPSLPPLTVPTLMPFLPVHPFQPPSFPIVASRRPPPTKNTWQHTRAHGPLTAPCSQAYLRRHERALLQRPCHSPCPP